VGFAGPKFALQLMSGYNKPWHVAGGWALDLYVVRERRKHSDLDIATYREDQMVLQEYFADRQLKKYTGPDGAERLETWEPGERLVQPDFEIVLEGCDPDYPRIELLLNESKGDDWIWRKNLDVRYPKSRVGMRSPEGIPFLCPEIVLLYKSRHVLGVDANEHKDQQDFIELKDVLEVERRNWLKATLETHSPGHPWISQL
jgi:hypothetical protein